MSNESGVRKCGCTRVFAILLLCRCVCDHGCTFRSSKQASVPVGTTVAFRTCVCVLLPYRYASLARFIVVLLRALCLKWDDQATLKVRRLNDLSVHEDTASRGESIISSRCIAAETSAAVANDAYLDKIFVVKHLGGRIRRRFLHDPRNHDLQCL